MGRLADKNILITGGNSGIGLAAAQEFDREGARVAICGLNERTLHAAKETLGAGSLAVRADVSNLADLDTMFATIKREFGHLDGVFVNAGYSEFLLFEDVTEQSFDKVIAVNFKGAYFTIQKALPLLRHGSSVIINASVGAHKGWPTTSTVSTCKAAVVHLARILSAELVDRGIRVNTLSPRARRTRLCSVASQAKSRARRLRTSSEPTIQASGWPIRWKSRSWQFTSRRTILLTSSGQTS